MSDAALLEEWRRLHDLPKTISGWPDWQTLPPRRTPSGVNYASADTTRQRLVVTLASSDGVAFEGVQLRLTSGTIIGGEVNANFEVEHQGEWVCIARMDIWPLAPHANRHWRQLGDDPEIAGSHHHTFLQNMRLGRPNFKPYGNLGSATKITPEPTSFRGILLLIQRFWSIDGAADLPPPELQETLW